MTATNHVMTGIGIGALLSNPYIALPAAFLSHFLLDALPHYDTPGKEHTSRRFLYTLLADCAVAGSLLLAILFLRPSDSSWLVLAGILAASPDLMWLPRWLNELRGKTNKPLSPPARFHSQIQRYAKPTNWPWEVAWFILMIGLLSLFLAR